jgi:hypothetical protein
MVAKQGVARQRGTPTRLEKMILHGPRPQGCIHIYATRAVRGSSSTSTVPSSCARFVVDDRL